jgi:predicted NAD/FAD-dependent oxidoreductase
MEPRLVGIGGMRRIPERVAAGLDVRSSIAIERLRVSRSGVEALSGNDVIARGSAVVLTPPLPQLLRLLDDSGIKPTTALSRRLRAVEYRATLAVMARLDAPSGLPVGHLAHPGEPLAWIADNHHKGISEIPAVTIHSTPGFAAAHIGADRSEWTRTLCEHAQPHLAGSIVAATGHGWRYAEPATTFDVGSELVSADRPVVLAGEVFAGARVEGAFLSGMAAADQVVSAW